ncbi:hypothetical protein Bbelb_220680 [Branchiostoma belcheri]|nr:hypothetical protein Bbelb_220680 [Branchiostoma belcheri]
MSEGMRKEVSIKDLQLRIVVHESPACSGFCASYISALTTGNLDPFQLLLGERGERRSSVAMATGSFEFKERTIAERHQKYLQSCTAPSLPALSAYAGGIASPEEVKGNHEGQTIEELQTGNRFCWQDKVFHPIFEADPGFY